MDFSTGGSAAMGTNMPMLPSTISEPPPAYSSTPPPVQTHHHSRTGYHNLLKDDTLYDPITGERLRGVRGGRYLDRTARANRQRLWCCFTLAMVLVMIALVIAGVVYHFGKTRNSNEGSDCVESVLNGYSCD